MASLRSPFAAVGNRVGGSAVGSDVGVRFARSMFEPQEDHPADIPARQNSSASQTSNTSSAANSQQQNKLTTPLLTTQVGTYGSYIDGNSPYSINNESNQTEENETQNNSSTTTTNHADTTSESLQRQSEVQQSTTEQSESNHE